MGMADYLQGMAAYIGTEESTSFWSKADIVVKELAKLHHHMGETLRAQLCITSRPVQRIRHISRVHANLNQICTRIAIL